MLGVKYTVPGISCPRNFQGWTRQLRDYADLAAREKIPFQLWIRPGGPGVGTPISRNLYNAEQRGQVILKYIGVD